MIYFNGCSFTRGWQLEHNLRDSWPAVLSAELNTVFYNHSKVGGSNERISRTTQNYILSKKVPVTRNIWTKEYLTEKFKKDVEVKLAIIMWTGINRMEFMQDREWRTANWEKFQLNPKNYLPTYESEVAYTRAQSVGDAEKFYLYLNGWMKTKSARLNLKNSISHMLSTKYFFDALEIPYLFYSFSSQHYKPLLHLLDEEYIEATNVEWPSIELSKKEILKELPFLKQEGFYEICKKENLPLGRKDHPDETGHERMAEIILKDIREKGYDKAFN